MRHRANKPGLPDAPERDALLADFGLVTSIKQGQVAFEGALCNDFLVSRLVVGSSEEDILL